MFQDKILSSATLTRSSIIEAAKQYMGVPFQHQGRSMAGIDCAGLVILTGKALGVIPPEFENKNYPRRTPHSGAFIKHFEEKLTQKNRSDMLPGDIVILKEPVLPCHCGIIGWRHDNLTLMHAYAPYKKVVEGFYYAENWDKLHIATFEFPATAPWPS